MTRKVFPVLLIVMLAAALVFTCAPASQASPGWATPLNISPGATTNNQMPQIALDASGHPHAVWKGLDAGVWRIYYAEDNGSGWTAPLNLSPGTTGNQNPRIALDASGNPHVVWFASDGLTNRIYYSENSGSGWSAPLNISPGATDNNLPQIALDASGNPHVVWHRNDGGFYQLYYSADTGSGWTVPLRLSIGITAGNSNPQITLDASGNPRVVWWGNDGSTGRIYYSAKTGSGWSAPAEHIPRRHHQ